MAEIVAGELYYDLDGQLWEIKRQLRQPGGYPFDPEMLKKYLQNAIEGKFFFSDPLKLILTKPFDPVEFLGKGWEIIEEDPRSSALSKEIEVDKLLFKTYLLDGESRITGETKVSRAKEDPDFIWLGANFFYWLWEDYQANKESSVLEFLHKTRGVSFMDFGTILRSPCGNRNVLYLYRRGDGSWDWRCSWLDGDWDAYNPSVGCAS